MSGLIVGGAASVLFQRNPLYGAFSLILSFIGLAVVYVMLGAQFLGVVQIVVYAGAIMVLFVFVIMLLNIREEARHVDHYPFLRYLALPLFLVLVGQVVYVVTQIDIPAAPGHGVSVGTVQAVGKGLLTDYLLPFEATSVLILMAIIGSMHLAKREKE